jgi:hypothetical protein
VKELPLKGTREARGQPPRCGAWLKRPMASKRSGERPTGKGTPASRPCLMGQRPHPMVLQIPKDDRDWPVWHASLKDVSGTPEIPADRSGYREERDGSDVSHRLKVTAEGISVNVGGPCGEGCCPPMKRMGVGGVIVLGARESCVRGEGRQGIDVVLVQ